MLCHLSHLFLSRNYSIDISTFGTKSFALIDYLVINILSLSNECIEYKKVWNESNAVKSLLKIAKLRKSTRYSAFSAIVRIADDYEIENIDGIINELNLT